VLDSEYITKYYINPAQLTAGAYDGRSHTAKARQTKGALSGRALNLTETISTHPTALGGGSIRPAKPHLTLLYIQTSELKDAFVYSES